MFKHLAKSCGSTINKLVASLLSVLLVTLFLYTDFTSIEIFFWIFLFAMFAWDIDARVSIAGALLFLVIIPILLILQDLSILNNTDNWTEQIAIWVFYFLSIGVMKQIWKIIQEKEIVEIIESKAVTAPAYTFKPTIEKAEIKPATKPKAIHDIKPPLPKKRI